MDGKGTQTYNQPEHKMSVIHTTTDYSMFSLLEENRNVGKLTSLRRSMATKNMLNAFPLIVNEKMQVIDGQHRLEVAKELGLQVFYIISSDVELHDVPMAAAAVSKWSNMDFCTHYAKKGVQPYAELLSILKMYPSVTFGLLSVAFALSGNHGMTGHSVSSFRNGTWRGATLPYIRRTLDICNRVSPVLKKEAWRRYFVGAVGRLVRWEDFDEELLIKKINSFPTEVVQCIDIRKTLEMLQSIYNYRNRYRITFPAFVLDNDKRPDAEKKSLF